MSVELNAKEKARLCGLYLSKFGRAGLERAGFQSFTEAFRDWGRLLHVKPSTMQNHRDWFDAHFPNHRRGWWQAPLPPAHKKVYEQFKDHDIEKLFSIIAGFTGQEQRSK